MFAAGRLLLGECDATRADVLGIVSLFFWTLVIVVTFKYVLFVMRADNHGDLPHDQVISLDGAFDI